MFSVTAPLSVPISKKKKFSLNLNEYRNTHYAILNKAKVTFTEMMSPRVRGIPKLSQATIRYVLYPARRGCDVANICSIVDKFFSDTLVKEGILPDDNVDFLKKVSYEFGSVDSKNPRVEIHIESDEPLTKEDPMIKIEITVPEHEVAAGHARKYMDEALASIGLKRIEEDKTICVHEHNPNSVTVEAIKAVERGDTVRASTADELINAVKAPEPEPVVEEEKPRRKYTRKAKEEAPAPAPEPEEDDNEDAVDMTPSSDSPKKSILDEIEEDLASGSDDLDEEEDTELDDSESELPPEEEEEKPTRKPVIFPRAGRSTPEPEKEEDAPTTARKTPFAGLRRPLNKRE